MKKILLSSLVALGLATSANADFIGASVGAGLWSQKIDGFVKSGDDTNYFNKKSARTDGDNHTGDLGLEGEQKPFLWAKVIHPIPLIPNVKAEYREYSFAGDGEAVGSLEIFGKSITLTDKVHTDMDIKSYDATFFYEINPVIVDLEFGIGINVLQGETTVKSTTGKDNVKWVAPLPYLYLRAESMSFFGFAVEAQAKQIESGENYYKDYDAGIKYFAPIPILDISAKLGYKKQDIQGVDGDDKTQIKFEGAYAEIAVKW
jgi:outer membrane protein